MGGVVARGDHESEEVLQGRVIEGVTVLGGREQSCQNVVRWMDPTLFKSLLGVFEEFDRDGTSKGEQSVRTGVALVAHIVREVRVRVADQRAPAADEPVEVFVG